MKSLKQTLFALTLTAIPTLGAAAVSESEAAQLGQSLTPMGAEKAGNDDGSIPAWSGGMTSMPEGYRPGDPYLNPFGTEKPLFVIDATNMQEYRENLTDGQVAMLERYPETFRIPVYQTHRTAAAPDWVYDNVLQNAVSAELVAGGAGFEGAYGGVPFPIPKSGLEAIWNHMTRYFGTYLERTSADIATQENGAYATSIIDIKRYSPFYQKDGDASSHDNILYYYLGVATSPPRTAGQVFIIHEPLNQVSEPRRAWIYNPGQRRVRRAPVVSYDTPVGSSDGLRTIDDTDMFNGAPDLYNWKLVGKREIYIPYNNYKLLDKSLEYDDIIQPGHLNPEYTRYELHRVWEVEATLKEGNRHIYSRRTFYIDEDSWSTAAVDLYDGQGELWRVSMAYLVNYYDLPAVLSSVDVFHDLNARRYQAQGLANEEREVIHFSSTPPEVRMFNPSHVRRFSGR
ncbi:DUF1329 domain-containing protein [Marinobacter confluentis]|uniref:DUF1329 domain-containing protein n=1 Tax=Marinobacter confluentis TaxID=1697557 RepID=A0A4Z1BDR8_9GAMM|nr:DUF1329 domain-containing protein [Marinobacter confluentis]TGN40454.1 DUF1329 domain-containing protein [Marinobacter confluentis]